MTDIGSERLHLWPAVASRRLATGIFEYRAKAISRDQRNTFS